MANDRFLCIPITKVVATYNQPDTGRTVLLKAEDGTTIDTASESPASSGQYLFAWDSLVAGPKYANVYVDGVAKPEWGRRWVGKESNHRQIIFYDVTVFDSGTSPSGAVGSPKTLTTGSGVLATDSDGNTSFGFSKVPAVFFSNKQSRLAFNVGLVTVSGGNATLTVSVTDDGDNYAAGTTCKADIMFEMRD